MVAVAILLRQLCALLLVFDAKSRAFGHLSLWKLMRGSRLLAAQMNSRLLPRWVSLVWMTSVLCEVKIQKVFHVLAIPLILILFSSLTLFGDTLGFWADRLGR